MARPRQVSDDEILEAARACFLEHGASVSTSVIAEHVGISQAAIFKRFGTKQELMVQALMPPAVPDWIDTIGEAPDDRPIPEQLTEILIAASRFFEWMSPKMAVLKSAGLDMAELLSRFDEPPPVLGWRRLTGWLRSAQRAGRVRSGNPETMAMMLLGALHGRVFMTHVLGLGRDVILGEHYAAELVQTLWCGLAPSCEEEP